MLLDYGLHFVFFLTILASTDARSRSEVNLQYVNGPADCGEDSNPSLCDSVAISEECEKNSTVIQSCSFSCSQSGQLWWAASEGKLAKVKEAISTGANLLCHKTYTQDGNDSPNMTALHLAARFDHPGVALALLDAGVDVDLQITPGATPTYYASRYGSTNALKVLIEHNADVNIALPSGSTPLMQAVRNDQLSVVKALINGNADVNMNGSGEPLIHAALLGYLGIAEALIKANASLDLGAPDTALYYAVYRKHTDIALLLIEHNADVNIAALSDGYTPLMWAARDAGQPRVLKALIKANASLDVIGGRYNGTALHYAAYFNNLETALPLIENNADVNIYNYFGLTPLMRASIDGCLNITKALINANASLDLTARCCNGATALHKAAQYNRPGTALLLLQSGADATITDEDGQTAAEYAKQSMHHRNYQLADFIERFSKITTTNMEDIISSFKSTSGDDKTYC